MTKSCKSCLYEDANLINTPCENCGVFRRSWQPKFGTSVKAPPGSTVAETSAKLTQHHDAHYQTKCQPIETMQANMTPEEFVGFLKGNIIKYACRCGKKDEALKEAQKIQRYADWLVMTLNGETINPRT